MKKKYLIDIISMISFLLMLSCSDDIISEKQDGLSRTPKKIESLIQYAKEQYNTNQIDVKLSKGNVREPSWENFEIFRQSNDTLAISIPIGTDSEGRRQILIANQVESEQQMFLVNLPPSDYDSLPMNIRRRIIVNINGEPTVCRYIRDKKGQLRFVKVRDVSSLKSAPLNGGQLPEVVVYPSGFDYGSDWWWWDYISGLISFPPPLDYGGFTGGYDDNINDNERPDYYKAENVTKDPEVKKNMKELFQHTKNDASKKNGRRERGFWVYYDTKEKKYYTGKEKTGEYVKGSEGTNASVRPGGSSPSANGSHIPNTATP